MSSSIKMTFVSDDQKHNSDLGHQEDALISRPELPPRMTFTSVQRSTPIPPHLSNENVFAVLLKNKRQVTSLTAGLIVLLGSGVHIVWAFWEVYTSAPYSFMKEDIILTVSSWYLAAICGGGIAAVIIPYFSKKFIYIIAASLLLLSSLFFISRHDYELRITSILVCGRFLGGLSFGIAYVTVITHAAENAVNQIRGVILRCVGYVLSLSLFIAGATTYETAGEEIGTDINSEFMMGYVNLFYSILALVLAPLLTIESAPFLLRRISDGYSVSQREAFVIAVMAKLRDETGETPKIRHDFTEMKHQLNEDEMNSKNVLSQKNLRPLFIVIGVRVLSVCAKNLPFTILIMSYFNHELRSQTFSVNLLCVLLTCRFIFGMITMFFIDKFECKTFLYISSIFCGFLLFVTCLVRSENVFGAQPVRILNYGIIIFFVFASMSIDCVGHVQTSEAFSYATKLWSIAIATGIEHIVHLLFIIIFKLEYNVTVFIIISIGLTLLGLSTLLTVPAKTKGLSLRQTRDIYRKLEFAFPSENA